MPLRSRPQRLVNIYKIILTVKIGIGGTSSDIVIDCVGSRLLRDREKDIYGDKVAGIAIRKGACEGCVMVMIRRLFHTLGSCIREENQLFVE
jgi:hypothetical protein